jgi:hypothetical protein
LLLAEVCVLSDRAGEAADAATSALEKFRRQRERGHEAWALKTLGDIAAGHGPTGATAAEPYYDAARTLAEALGMRPLVARCNLGLARVFAGTGQRDRAQPAFQTACAIFRELRMRADLARAEDELTGVT